MPDVFLSYTSADRAAAARVQAAFADAGLDVFWDQEVPPGEDWDAWIRAKLTAAKVAVVLWTRTSIASPNVRHEAMIARDASKLVPVLVDPLKPEDFPMGLYLVQAVKLDGWAGDAADPRFQRLQAEVFARLKRPAPAAVGAAKRGPAPVPTWPIVAAVAVATVALIISLAALPRMIVERGAEARAESAKEAVAIEAPAPAAPASPIEALLGRWDWGGGCGDPSVVTREGEAGLVFTTAETRFVHEIGAVKEGEVETVVVEPRDFAGDVYRLTLNGDVLTVTQVSPTNAVNTWPRCQ